MCAPGRPGRVGCCSDGKFRNTLRPQCLHSNMAQAWDCIGDSTFPARTGVRRPPPGTKGGTAAGEGPGPSAETLVRAPWAPQADRK